MVNSYPSRNRLSKGVVGRCCCCRCSFSSSKGASWDLRQSPMQDLIVEDLLLSTTAHCRTGFRADTCCRPRNGFSRRCPCYRNRLAVAVAAAGSSRERERSQKGNRAYCSRSVTYGKRKKEREVEIEREVRGLTGVSLWQLQVCGSSYCRGQGGAVVAWLLAEGPTPVVDLNRGSLIFGSDQLAADELCRRVSAVDLLDRREIRRDQRE